MSACDIDEGSHSNVMMTRWTRRDLFQSEFVNSLHHHQNNVRRRYCCMLLPRMMCIMNYYYYDDACMLFYDGWN